MVLFLYSWHSKRFTVTVIHLAVRSHKRLGVQSLAQGIGVANPSVRGRPAQPKELQQSTIRMSCTPSPTTNERNEVRDNQAFSKKISFTRHVTVDSKQLASQTAVFSCKLIQHDCTQMACYSSVHHQIKSGLTSWRPRRSLTENN